MKKWMWLLLPLGGALTGLPLILPQLGFLAYASMLPAILVFFIAVREGFSLGKLYLMGFCYYFPFYLVNFHWFIDLYPMSFMNVTKGEAAMLVAVCWLGLSLLQTVFSALVLPLLGLLSRTRVIKDRPLLLPLLFAAQYTVAEWSQTLTWMGVPWARLALGQIEYGLVSGSAALFGSYFITFAIVLCNGYLACLLLFPQKRRICAGVSLATLVALLLCGTVGVLAADPTDGRPLTVAAVQGNVGSDLKWSLLSREKSYEIYEKYTREAVAAGATVVAFPETFIPDQITPNSDTGRFVAELAVKYGVTIYFGAFYEDAAHREYNAVFCVDPDGSYAENVYAKRHLVPFGEYVPWRPFFEAVLPMLADIGMLSGDLTAGEGPALFESADGKFGVLVCFDSIYEELTRDSVQAGAELLLLPTNDSWFTDSRGVYMHHAQARLRAIESGKWILRAADTGISSLIAPDGSVTADLPPMVEGVSVGTVYVREGTTLYCRIGNLLVWLLIAGLFALPLSEAVFCVKRRKTNV